MANYVGHAALFTSFVMLVAFEVGAFAGDKHYAES